MTTSEDFARLTPEIVRHFWGEPNRRLSHLNELRWGTNGSKSLDLKAGVWFNHEQSVGGGCLDLIERETGHAGKDAVQWLIDHGFHVRARTGPTAAASSNGHDRDEEPPWEPPGESPDEADPTAVEGTLHICGFHEAAVFDYRGPNDQLILQVVRFEADDGSGAKTFRQRTPAAGGWSWSAKGVTHVPYRLAELREALRDGSTIFIVEGEKCADALLALGVPATTNAGGAGKWQASLTPYFEGADVVILPDDDPQARKPDGTPRFHDNGLAVLPGWDHAKAVAAALAPVAKRVRFLKLTDRQQKEDVHDWLAADGTVDELYELARAAPIYQPDEHRGNGHDANRKAETTPPQSEPLPFIDVSGWDDQPAPPRQWAVANRIPLRQPTLLSGEGAIGKTILLLQLCVAHVLGRDWLGTMPEPGSVIYFGAEDDTDELHRRLADIAAHYRARFSDVRHGGLNLLSFAGQDALLATVDRTGIVQPTPLFERLHLAALDIRPKSVVLDTVADIFPGNENDRAQVRQFVGLLRRLAINADCAVIVSAHPSLTGINSGTGLSGSTGWHNSMRARMYFKTATTAAGEEPDKELRELQFLKSNYGPLAGPILLRWRNGVFVPEGVVGSLEKLVADQRVDELFLKLLGRFNQQGRNVSHNPGRTYAPALFASELDSVGTTAKSFAAAMRRLFASNKIHVQKIGPPSHQRAQIMAGVAQP